MFILDAGMPPISGTKSAAPADKVKTPGGKKADAPSNDTKTSRSDSTIEVDTSKLADKTNLGRLISNYNKYTSNNPTVALAHALAGIELIKKASSDPKVAKSLNELEKYADSKEAKDKYAIELAEYKHQMLIYEQRIKLFNMTSGEDGVPTKPTEPINPEDMKFSNLQKKVEFYKEVIKENNMKIKELKDLSKGA